MTLSSLELATLTAQIAAAGLDSRRWQDVIDSLFHYSGGVKTQMSCRNITTGMSTKTFFSGFDPYWVKQFHEYYHSVNPWTAKYAQVKVGSVTSSQWLYPQEELLNTEFYNDWVKPQEDILYGASVLLLKENQSMVTLSGNIYKQGGNEKEQQWIALLRLITPHLQQSLAINKVLFEKTLENYVLGCTDVERASGIFLLSNSGRLRYCNSRGELLLEEGSAIKLNMNSHIAFFDTNAMEQLENLFYVVKRHSGQNYPFNTFTIKDNLSQTYICRTLAIATEALTTSSYGALLDSDEPGFVLTVCKLEDKENELAKLSAIAKLTRAEEEITKERHTSIHTVRGQFKTAMAKLNVNSQVELIRLMNHS